MERKGIRIFVLASIAVFMMLCFALSGAYAYEGKGSKDGDLYGKFCHKASIILSNEEELGLSSEQVSRIKELSLKTKKDMIKLKADIETVSVDIGSKMHDEVLDTKTLNKLIDQKYELKKTKEKAIVEAIASLKNTLTNEQLKTLKELYKRDKYRMPCEMGKR